MLYCCFAGRVAFSHLFFFNDTATTEIYTLSLHDALPISGTEHRSRLGDRVVVHVGSEHDLAGEHGHRSEEHTSELQSRPHLVCRLLLEKKKNKKKLKGQSDSGVDGMVRKGLNNELLK